jgi:hypothetical protein
MDTPDHGQSQILNDHAAVANCLTRHKTHVGDVSSFLNGAEHTKIFKGPHRYKATGLKSGERGGQMFADIRTFI